MNKDPFKYAQFRWIKWRRGIYYLERESSWEQIGVCEHNAAREWGWRHYKSGRHGIEKTREDCKVKLIEAEKGSK